MPHADTTTEAVADRVETWRLAADWRARVQGVYREADESILAACDLIEALAADRDAWRKRAEDAEACGRRDGRMTAYDRIASQESPDAAR